MDIKQVLNLKAKCIHGEFQIDEALNIVECGKCGSPLNPMWVLKRLAQSESQYKMRIERLKQTLVKASKKNRCKCQHCKKMTIIQKG